MGVPRAVDQAEHAVGVPPLVPPPHDAPILRGESWLKAIERCRDSTWVWTVPAHSGGPQRSTDARRGDAHRVRLSGVERQDPAHEDGVVADGRAPDTRPALPWPPRSPARVPEGAVPLRGRTGMRARAGAKPVAGRDGLTGGQPLGRHRAAAPSPGPRAPAVRRCAVSVRAAGKDQQPRGPSISQCTSSRRTAGRTSPSVFHRCPHIEHHAPIGTGKCCE